MTAANEVGDLEHNRYGHANHRELAVGADDLVTIVEQFGCLERHGRILGDVEEILAFHTGVKARIDRLDRCRINRDVDRPVPCAAIERHLACRLAERPTLDRKSHVVDFEHRLRVHGVDVIGVFRGSARRGDDERQCGTSDESVHFWQLLCSCGSAAELPTGGKGRPASQADYSRYLTGGSTMRTRTTTSSAT